MNLEEPRDGTMVKKADKFGGWDCSSKNYMIGRWHGSVAILNSHILHIIDLQKEGITL